MDAAGPPTVGDVVRRYKAAMAKRDWGEARAIAMEATDRFPDDARLVHLLAVTEHRLGMVSEAIRHGLQAVAMNDKDVGSASFVSTVLMQNGFLADARSRALAALEASPDHAGVLTLLSEIALTAGDLQDAHRWADRAITTNPQNASSYLCRANAHLQIAEYDYADVALREAARLAPEHVGIKNKLAVLDAIRDRR